jgi:hypothetical protein
MTEAKPKPPLSALLITKTGVLISRPINTAPSTIIVPMNTPGDSRMFLRDGVAVQVSEKVSFKHLKNVPVAGLMIAIYEEYDRKEFDPTGLTPLPLRSLETDFTEMNPDLAA